jgi:hypothetical protein
VGLPPGTESENCGSGSLVGGYQEQRTVVALGIFLKKNHHCHSLQYEMLSIYLTFHIEENGSGGFFF